MESVDSSVRIEILTEIDRVDFAECHAGRVEDEIDGTRAHLIQNKTASGRHQDLDDLENL